VTERAENILGCSILTLSLLFAIAIFLPSFLTSQTAAREVSALHTLLSIYETEKEFQAQSEGRRYGSLEELGTAGLIDADLARGRKYDYKFEVILQGNSFEAYATPFGYSRWSRSTGKRAFFVNDDRLVTYAEKRGARAGPDDEPLE
jgi:hypothetical protein